MEHKYQCIQAKMKNVNKCCSYIEEDVKFPVHVCKNIQNVHRYTKHGTREVQ